MSTVSPSESAYKFYKQKVDELEDERKAEVRNTHARDTQQAKKRETATEAAIKDYSEDIDHTVQAIRENSNEAIERERRKSEDEVKRLRAETYSKSGRFGAEHAAREELRSAEESFKSELNKQKETNAKSQEHYERQMYDQAKTYEQENEQAIAAAKASVTESAYDKHLRENSQDKSDIADLKRRYQETIVRTQEDPILYHKQYENATAEMQRDFNRRIKKMEAQQSKSSDNSQAEAGKRLTHMTEIQSKVYENDTQQLRDQLKFMEELDRKRAKAVNEKATQAVKDYESDGRAREKLILDSSIAEKQKLKNSIEENEVYQNRIAQDVVRTKNDQFSETTARMNRQNAEALKDLQGAFTRERDQTRSLNDATHLAQQRNYDERLAETNDKSAKAIAKQSQEFQAARKTLNDEHATEMKSMKEVVQKVTTTDDPTVVSPAAEASIKRALYTQHQKEMDEKATNTERKISSVRDDFKERIADLEAKSKASDMMIRNAAMAELNQTKASYSQFLEDAEFQKTQALKNKDQTNERQKELLTKNSYRTLESQRRQFEELMESQRFDHADKIQALRNESDFKLKIAYRESAAKYAELSQQFNRRLVEQKEEAQNLLESTKQENAKLLKETERRNQNQMEEQNRNFQQRVQQLELQQKDRERSIAQSYETELDKLRHTNAKLSQTKG